MTAAAPTSSKRSSPTVELFPFLAVLVCAMGALILVLMILTRQARTQHAREAQAKMAQQRVEIKATKQLVSRKVRQLKQSQQVAASQLADARLTLGHVEEHFHALQGQLAGLQSAWKDLDDFAKNGARGRDMQEAELARLNAEIAKLLKEIGNTRNKAETKKRSFAIVPYEGPYGTHRRPIYVECCADAIILQPEGVILPTSDFREPVGPGNTLATGLRAIREYWAQHGAAGPGKTGEPYPLLLVRPGGIAAYYTAREAMTGWGAEFGYEFVGEDWDLKYPKADRALAEMLSQQVAVARVREQALRQQLIAAAPQNNGHSRKQKYRVAPGGGIMCEGGDDDDDDEPHGTHRGSYDSSADGGSGGPGGGGRGSGGGPSGAGGGGGYGSGDVAGGGPYHSFGGGAGGAPGSGPAGAPGNVYSNLGGAPGGSTGQGVPGGGPAGASGNVYSNLGGGAPGGSTGQGVPGGGPTGAPGNVYSNLGGAPGGSTGQGMPGGAAGSYAMVTGGGPGNGNGYGGSPGGFGNGSSSNPSGGYGSGPGGGGSGTGPGGGGYGTGPGGGSIGSQTNGYASVPGNGYLASQGNGSGGNPGNGPGPSGIGGNGYGTNPGGGVANGQGNGSGGNPGNGPGPSGIGGNGYGTNPGGGVANGQGNGSGGSPGNGPGPSGNGGNGYTSGQGNGSGGGPQGASPAANDGPYTALDAMNNRMREASPPAPTSSPRVAGGGDGEVMAAPHIGQWEPTPTPPPKDERDDKLKDQNKPSDANKIADHRGIDWALHDKHRGAVPLTRPIRIECYSDHLVILPEPGMPGGQVIPLGPRTESAVDGFVKAVWEHVEPWGMAGRHMYWKPILDFQVMPGAEPRYADLHKLLDGSGLAVQRKP